MDLNLDEIISQLKKFPAPYQRDAVDLCLAGDEKVVSRLLSELHLWRHSDDSNSPDFGTFPIYALHILGYLKEKRLFSLLLEIVNLPENHPIVDEMGDYITERLYVELYRTCNGDFNGIREALLNRKADVYGRWQCLRVLEAAVAYGEISEESLIQELLGYLQNQILQYTDKEQVSYEESDFTFAGALILTLRHFEVSEHHELILKAYSLDILDTSIVEMEWFKKNPNSRRIANLERINQDCEETVHKAMEWWACFQPQKNSFNYLTDFQQLVDSKNKKQKIGRNDPCPCGSGKKYKKCCLVEEI